MDHGSDQSGVSPAVCQDVEEMFRFSGAPRGNNRNMNACGNEISQVNFITVLGAVGIDRVQADLPRAQTICLYCPPQGVNTGIFSAAMNDDFVTGWDPCAGRHFFDIHAQHNTLAAKGRCSF